MGKKMKLPIPFLFRAPESASTATATATATTSWPSWPACTGNPKTPSFRAAGDCVFKTMNSAYVDTIASSDDTGSSFKEAEPEEEENGRESIEAVIRGLRTADRLFFDPGESCSILAEAEAEEEEVKTGGGDEDDDVSFGFEIEFGFGFGFGLGESSSVVGMESRDPHVDFKRSMEEMVEAHGVLKDWERLQELLGCYLSLNPKSNHGYIISAFLDLLVDLSLSSSSPSSDHNHNHNIDQSCSSSASTSSIVSVSPHSPISPLSFSSTSTTSSTISPCLSTSFEEEEEEEEEEVDHEIEKSLDK